jgi:hypothetical protein
VGRAYFQNELRSLGFSGPSQTALIINGPRTGISSKKDLTILWNRRRMSNMLNGFFFAVSSSVATWFFAQGQIEWAAINVFAALINLVFWVDSLADKVCEKLKRIDDGIMAIFSKR